MRIDPISPLLSGSREFITSRLPFGAFNVQQELCPSMAQIRQFHFLQLIRL
jgi:hypothetical protein